MGWFTPGSSNQFLDHPLPPGCYTTAMPPKIITTAYLAGRLYAWILIDGAIDEEQAAELTGARPIPAKDAVQHKVDFLMDWRPDIGSAPSTDRDEGFREAIEEYLRGNA